MPEDLKDNKVVLAENAEQHNKQMAKSAKQIDNKVVAGTKIGAAGINSAKDQQVVDSKLGSQV